MTDYKEPIIIEPIGRVRSEHRDRRALPHNGRGRDIQAEIDLLPDMEPAAREIRPGNLIWVLTWLHLAERQVRRVHPRGDLARPEKGVFSTRSPARPNPIGLSLVEVIGTSENSIRVKGLEVVDGTPVLDIKSYQSEMDR
ncbi:MAG: tRNA (N6-threonylcarbamoyladenosine(37)-N6)-methyltransferase TrmO [Thermodesulfobacteriota bacterium]|nr:tRNA (N6-threonylcarbamoyladenosine(37)-N6)-methyltransferase TrmO [Thermodesulfobacteriota bacterium]